jgi:hypothetical protein
MPGRHSIISLHRWTEGAILPNCRGKGATLTGTCILPPHTVQYQAMSTVNASLGQPMSDYLRSLAKFQNEAKFCLGLNFHCAPRKQITLIATRMSNFWRLHSNGWFQPTPNSMQRRAILVGNLRIQRKNLNNVEEHIPKHGNDYLAIRFHPGVSNCRGVCFRIDWTPRSVLLHLSRALSDWFCSLIVCIGLRMLRND